MKKKLLLMPAFLLIMLNFYCKKDSSPEVTPLTKTAEAESLSLVPPGHFVVIAGKNNTYGYQDGNRAKARFRFPSGICVIPGGSILVADYGNGYIRKIESDTVVTTLHFPKVKHGDDFSGVDPYDVAETKDGAIGILGDFTISGGFNFEGLWVFNPNGQSSGYSVVPHDTGDEFGGIDKDVNNNLFWYTGSSGVGTITSTGGGYDESVTNNENAYELGYGAVSSCSNGVKYFADYASMYKLTKEGVQAQIFKNLSFTGISSIRANTGGSKIYVVENGDIKVINNCTGCTVSEKTILAGQSVSYIALSNSEKYLYFTSSSHHTVNKLTL